MAKRIQKIIIIFLCLLIVFGGIFGVLYFTEVKEVQLSGNTFSSSGAVLRRFFPNKASYRLGNVLLKSIFGITDDAFDEVSLEMQSVTACMLTVKEGTPALVIGTADGDIYVNRKGIVLSYQGPENPVRLTGADVSRSDELMPVVFADGDLFADALEIADALLKDGLNVSEIMYGQEGFSLIYGDIRIIVKDSALISEKVSEIQKQIPQYKGLKGTLHMETISRDGPNTGFYFVVDP